MPKIFLLSARFPLAPCKTIFYIAAMEQRKSIFETFGGVRPMARALSLPPQNVNAWKRVGRIPSEKQPLVLSVAKNLGLPVTADDVVFPLGNKCATITNIANGNRSTFTDKSKVVLADA